MRAPPWAHVCARGVPLLSTALLVLNRCPGRGALLCEGARGGGILGIFESRWHLSHSQRGRCVTWGRRRAAGGDTDLRWGQAPSHVLCMLRACVWGLSCAGAPRGRRRRMSSKCGCDSIRFSDTAGTGRRQCNRFRPGPSYDFSRPCRHRTSEFPLHLPRGQRGRTMRTCFRCCMYMHMCTRRRSQTPLHSHTPRVQLYTQISPITE